MSSKISDERLAEILGSDMAVGTSEQVVALIWELAREVSEYRARGAAREYALGRPASMPDMSGRDSWTIVGGPYSNYQVTRNLAKNRPEVKGQPVTVLTRLVGPWEAVGDDD